MNLNNRRVLIAI